MGVITAIGWFVWVLLTILLWAAMSLVTFLGITWVGTKYGTIINWSPKVQNTIGCVMLVILAIVSWSIMW